MTRHALLVNQLIESINRTRCGAGIIFNDELEWCLTELCGVNFLEREVKGLLHELTCSSQASSQRENDADGNLAALICGRLGNWRRSLTGRQA